MYILLSTSHPHIACGCYSTGVGAAISDSSSVAVGAAAAGGFIGGVLLTAAIGGVVAVALFCRVKRELTAATSNRLVYYVACIRTQTGKVHTIMYNAF